MPDADGTGRADPDSHRAGVTVYREVSLLMKKAEDLRRSGKPREALAIYKDLLARLLSLKRNNPAWDTALTSKTVDLCRARIESLENALGAGAGAAPAGSPHLRTEAGETAPRRPAESTPEGGEHTVHGFLDRLIAENRGSVAAYRERARLRLAQEMYALAADDYRRVIEMEGEEIDSLYGLGTACEKLAEKLDAAGKRDEASERFRDAAAAYKKVIWRDPRYAPAYYSLGCVYARMGMRADAVHYFRKARAIAGEDTEIARRARYNIGLLGER